MTTRREFLGTALAAPAVLLRTRLAPEPIGHGGFRYRPEPGWAGLDPASSAPG